MLEDPIPRLMAYVPAKEATIALAGRITALSYAIMDWMEYMSTYMYARVGFATVFMDGHRSDNCAVHMGLPRPRKFTPPQFRQRMNWNRYLRLYIFQT